MIEFEIDISVTFVFNSEEGPSDGKVIYTISPKQTDSPVKAVGSALDLAADAFFQEWEMDEVSSISFNLEEIKINQV